MTAPHNRLEGLDLARAMALLGMVLVNFRIAMGVLAGGPTWLKPLLDALEGRSAASFVVLAGIGLGLSTRKLAWSAAMTHTARLGPVSADRGAAQLLGVSGRHHPLLRRLLSAGGLLSPASLPPGCWP